MDTQLEKYYEYYAEWLEDAKDCLSKIYDATDGLPDESRKTLNDKGVQDYFHYQERRRAEKAREAISFQPSGNDAGKIKQDLSAFGEPKKWTPVGAATVDGSEKPVFHIKFSDGSKADVPFDSLETAFKKNGETYFKGDIRGYRCNLFPNGENNYSVHELR